MGAGESKNESKKSKPYTYEIHNTSDKSITYKFSRISLHTLNSGQYMSVASSSNTLLIEIIIDGISTKHILGNNIKNEYIANGINFKITYAPNVYYLYITKSKEKRIILNEECVVCMEKKRTYILKNCGHLCLCKKCAPILAACPICRIPYESNTDLIKIYL